MSDIDQRLAQRTAMTNDPLNTNPTSPVAQPRGTLPNTMLVISVIAFALGISFSAGVVILALSWHGPAWQLGFFVASWSLFHVAEFAVTAGWNRDKLSVDSFLLNNGIAYHIANGSAVLEWAAVCYLKPQWKACPYVSAAGIVLTVIGQSLRSMAMVHASTNFSHQVAFRKASTHKLVTDGVYAWSRHPSYAGFFYWGLGTQLVLQNSVTFVIFLVVLWRFFYERIKGEEKHLIRFFGDDYVAYKVRVGTKIPFIP